MPHLTIEHSANVADLVDIATLVDAVHDTALATGIAPLDGLRTRAASWEHCAIADRDPSNAFVAITARLGTGRTESQKQLLMEALLSALDDVLGDAQRHVMLSVEFQEIDPALRINKNNLRSVIAERRAPGPDANTPAEPITSDGASNGD